MTIFYDHRQFETLSFSKNKSDDEQQRIDSDVTLTATVCKQCIRPIYDKYYYDVDGLPLHSSCLRCYACHNNLTELQSCFSRNEKIWCKEDYDRQFRCQKCFELLKPSDLIMRSGYGDQPYHVHCFRCDVCDVLLVSGDPYGCSDNRLYCKNDFLATHRSESARIDNGAESVYVEGVDILTSDPLSSLCRLNVDNYITNKMHVLGHGSLLESLSINTVFVPSSEEDRAAAEDACIDETSSIKEYTPLQPCAISNDNIITFSDQNKVSDQKIEKTIQNIHVKSEKISSPVSNFEQEDKNVEDTACSNELSSETDLGKEAIDHNSTQEASTFGTEEEDVSGTSCSGESEDKLTVSGKQTLSKKGTNNLRQKRVRTSFKHQQLRAMKTYFTMNHNPDSKDLRQLSQKTGLSKRVLQVWFQNARAKFRRSLCRPMGIMCPPSSNQMQMSNLFDESMSAIDKNGNYPNKSKINAFTDISSSILNHSVSNSHRMCNMADLGYPSPNNSNGSLISSLTNFRDRYLPSGKQFIPTSNYYNSPLNQASQNSPSLFSMDVGNLAANLGLVDFSCDNVESFHLTELGMVQKL